MGICASCLGLGRASDSDHSDSSHLLSDPYHNYGSINVGSAHGGVPQPDPEEIRRQRDALERICAQTSDKLIDVSQSTFTDEGSRMTTDWHRLFKERFPDLRAPPSRPATADGADNADAEEEETDEHAWLSSMIHDPVNPLIYDRVIPLESGTLTVQFDEALLADKRR